MSKLFPQISSLSPELTGGQPEIYCKVAGLPKKVPLSLVSNGITKVLAMILFISTHPGGVVVIDEVENGVYYKTLPRLWEVMVQLCLELNVQVFASTHSKELLENLAPLVEKHKQEFRLIRTEVGPDGHTARISAGGDFVSALETGTEVR